jgi:hypothetical protein
MNIIGFELRKWKSIKFQNFITITISLSKNLILQPQNFVVDAPKLSLRGMSAMPLKLVMVQDLCHLNFEYQLEVDDLPKQLGKGFGTQD